MLLGDQDGCYYACTTSVQRRIGRWEHEHVLEEMETEVANNPNLMVLRKSTVEHPFGTIKLWMGADHFNMREMKNVATEMSLHVLAYNLKRVMNIMGNKSLMEAIMA
jgi:predicted RecB family nuclease